VAQTAGLAFTHVNGMSGHFYYPEIMAPGVGLFDYDNDGDLDVYASDRTGANRLFQNTGGRFSQVLAGEGPSDTRATVGACWFDADRDGDQQRAAQEDRPIDPGVAGNDGDRNAYDQRGERE